MEVIIVGIYVCISLNPFKNMKKDFVKVRDMELSQQLKAFHAGLLSIGKNHGFTDAEIEEAGKDAAAFAYTEFLHDKYTQHLKSLTAFKNEMKTGAGGVPVELPVLDLSGAEPVIVPDGIVSRFRAKAAKMKASANYSTAIGLQLQIEGVDVPDEDPNTAKPLIGGLRIASSKVELKWKKGSFDGIRVFRKIDGGEFVLSGFSVSPPYIDNTPLPSGSQVWTYAIQYFIDDNEVGLISDPSSISVTSTVGTV